MHSILLVDDNEEFLRSFKALLDKRYRVLTALNVSGAVRILGEEMISTVFTDYRMTGPSGLDLVKFVQALRPRPPIILLSAFVDKEVALRCVNSGVFDVVEKPFKWKEISLKLTEAIHFYLQSNHLEEHAEKQSDRIDVLIAPHSLGVNLNGRSIKLTSTEFEIFNILYANKGSWVSRRYLEEQVWRGRSISRNLFDTHFSNLRKKIPEMKDDIKALRGRGYMFKHISVE